MSKKLVEEIKRSSPFDTEAQARRAMLAVVGAVTALTGRGVPVQIREFGTFERKHRKAKVGRNPRTGEAIPIAARDVLTFRATK